jgi:hypothetical protein
VIANATMSDWACEACHAANAAEDRYCGECGLARDRTLVAPVVRAAVPSSAPLADVPETPDGGRSGAFRVAAAGLVGAAAFGVLYHIVSLRLDLMILFPALLGFAVGGVLRMAALKSGCRRALFLVGVAILSALAAYGLRETLDTRHFQAFLNQRRTEGAPALTFGDALRRRAEMGISFGSRAGRPPVSGAGFWIYILVQGALAAGVAAVTVAPVAGLAYCGRCRSFVPTVPIFRANARDADGLAEAVRHQKWKEAQFLANRSSSTPKDRAEAILIRCSGCGGCSLRVDVHQGRRSKKVMHVALPPDSLESLARMS